MPPGVLTGAGLTDIRCTLIGGRAHVKHTESSDFREAVRRAVRQGLMKTESILLEPYYEYKISVPTESLGRAMNDIHLKSGTASIISQDEELSVIEGRAPCKELFNYQSELTKYTSGRGRIEAGFSGYEPCKEEDKERIIADSGYDPETDAYNPSGSIFVEHGAGRYVPWYECEALMHLPDREADFLQEESESDEDRLKREAELVRKKYDGSLSSRLEAIGTDEIDEILRKATHSNAGEQRRTKKKVYYRRSIAVSQPSPKSPKVKIRPGYLLVDGYNIIHAFEGLKMYLSDGYIGMDSAKYRLLEMLSEYRVVRDTEVIVVFDAYKSKGHVTEKMDYMGVHIVYTREAETADQYIARFTVQNARDLDITVATSDGMVQLIIRGEDSRIMSARDLEEDIRAANIRTS